jgi:hypothetical protein
VLGVPGVKFLVLADAVNDLGQGGRPRPEGGTYADVSVDDLSFAYLQMLERAHEAGVKVILATMPPMEGAPFPGFYSEAKEKVRQDFNAWAREKKGMFDGFIDIDMVMRDPAHPTRNLPEITNANHFGPNAAGEKKIAGAVDLGLFR